MEEKSVIAIQPAITALNSLLHDFARTTNSRPEVVGFEENGFEVDSLRMNVNPETALATYEWDGSRLPFTAGDYVFWLEDLPFQEALNRTAASVGRAMRNELLARAGKEAGYDDAMAGALQDRSTLLARARMMRDFLRYETDTDVPEELIQRAFKARGLDRRRQYRADFEMALFSTMTQAQNIARRVRTGLSPLSSFPGYRSETDVLLLQVPALAQHIRFAPLDSIVVAGTRQGWMVLNVSLRELVDLDSGAERQLVIDQLRPLAREYQLISRLRESADIEVDEILFSQMYLLESFRAKGRKP